jgi:hypothetical protein
VKCVIAVHDMTDEKLLCSKYEVLLYKNGLKPAVIRKSKTKTKSRKSNEETKADNALEYENDSLKRIINLMEVKNRVLEENCNLLKEKNFYFESRLKQIEMESDVSDKEGRLEKDSEEEESDESHKSKSLKDRISGVLFGVALPKLPHILGKIKEKKNEIKSFIEEHGNEGIDCPMQNGGVNCPLKNGKFEETIAAVKVNLFRVVVVLGTLMVLSGVGYAGYRIWKNRYRHPSYLVPSEDDDEEDSGDELFRAPGTSRGAANPLISNSTESFETPGISTDFRSILDTANNK